jgi:ribosomal protein L11 methyltransferase
VAGFYRRGPGHAPAPAGLPELVQVPGSGFGPYDHPTTTLCLAALRDLPPVPALDAGCGSGLLALAWARLGLGPVVAVDLDQAACEQARRSAAASGLAGRVRVERRDVGRLPPDLTSGRTLLANLPAPAQAALLGALGEPPRAALLSGLRPGEAEPIVRGYRHLGLEPVGMARAGGHERWTLVA